MMGLDAQLLDGAAPDKRVSRTAAGVFGFLMALAVLCVEEFRMARVSPTPALPLGLVRASAAPSTGCQLYLASHYINDQKKFKETMDTITPEMMPKGVTSHAFLPSADGHTAFCVWEAAAGVAAAQVHEEHRIGELLAEHRQGLRRVLAPAADHRRRRT